MSILYMVNLELKYADNFKHLSFIFSSDQKDDKDRMNYYRHNNV